MKAEDYFEPNMVALIRAIEHKDQALASQYIEEGLSLNIRGEHGITPLFYLISKKKLDVIELALKLGADPNYKAMVYPSGGARPWESSPIDMLSDGGSTEIFELLLKYGADPNTIDTDGNPILFNVIGQDDWDKFDLILKYGGDINGKDSGGRRASMYAANLLKFDFVVKLINLGDDIYSPSNNGDTIGYTVTFFENQKKDMPAYQLPDELYEVKRLLEERGIKFPALELKEVRERMKKGLPIQ